MAHKKKPPAALPSGGRADADLAFEQIGSEYRAFSIREKARDRSWRSTVATLLVTIDNSPGENNPRRRYALEELGLMGLSYKSARSVLSLPAGRRRQEPR